jgi:lipopolysaccharide transport system ATP-binding protein
MSRTALAVNNISKCYRKYQRTSDRFLNWFGFSIAPIVEYWAVKDVSFELEPGESLALIGQNGAGKSTLLKLITGTIRPSKGEISFGGKISAILELGMGFNQELTGRQNVFLAGGLMGFSAENLERLIPGIEDFSELGLYFDKPLRTYSSGMQARLAFSLATAIRPEILIVDEVLSVGDSYFQHKSFSRIRQFKEQGCTILFVTHSMGDVREICDRVILLDKGKVLRDGAPDEVVDFYNAMIAERENPGQLVEQRRQHDGWMLTRSGIFDVIAQTLKLVDAVSGEIIATARVGQKLILELTALINKETPKLVLGYMLRDRTGHVVWGTNTWHTGQIQTNLVPGETVIFRMPFTCMLGPGSYSFSPALCSSATHMENNFEWTDNALVFEVINVDYEFFIGSNYLDASFVISREEKEK